MTCRTLLAVGSVLSLGLWWAAGGARADVSADDLAKGFAAPPDSAKPHTWWHWMNGNVTREGITADLEAMHRVGVGGAQIFNADCGIPAGPVKFLSPEWHALFQHAVREADRLGIELCVHNCAGWSSSGGPWNTPEHAMQTIVTSEKRVQGPMKFSEVLPAPPAKLDFYRDIAVLAFRAPKAEGERMAACGPVARCEAPGFEGKKLLDGKEGTFVTLPVPEAGKPQVVELELARPMAARTMILTPGRGMPECSGAILVSDDGKKYRTLRSFSYPRGASRPLTLSLGSEPLNARFYLVRFQSARADSRHLSLAEIELSPRLFIENLDAKAGFSGGGVAAAGEPGEAPGQSLPRAEIVDLSARLAADGRLEWDVPAGDWTILRLGHTPTGKSNHPAPAEGTGPECDKFSRAALDAHWAGYVKTLVADAGPLAGKSFNNVLIDSYEVGGQNWTPKFREEFRARRGYDLFPFLPAFAGRIVESPAATERFLWDVRRTIADLFAENYYGYFAELCHRSGLKASIEPYTGPFESLQCGAPADIPMGEFWTGSSGHGSVKLAASVAHLNGRAVVGAESFTSKPPERGRWQEDPFALKALGDLIYCQGVNRYIFHRYAMQPWTNRVPGMTMGQWGFHFDRTSTWWDQGRAWLSYVARCQFLLQQGKFVADACYFCGEGAPVELKPNEPALPKGYDYDGINAETILKRLTVREGLLTLPDGMSYRLLVIPAGVTTMTPELLAKIRQLVADGATIVGARPTRSPSLQGYPKCDAEVKALADELWGTEAAPAAGSERRVGKGRVFCGRPMEEVLAALGAKPDFEVAGDNADADLRYIHRRSGGADLYFVSNQRASAEAAEAVFRAGGRQPELWHADTGVMEKAPLWREQDGRTRVALRFEPAGSVFVVFRAPAAAGDHFVSAAPAGAAAAAAAPAPRIEIRRASYEAVDGAAAKDVTAILQKMSREGAAEVVAANETFGGDPIFKHVKQLRVEYELGGQLLTNVVHEKGRMALAGARPPAEPPSFDLAVRADGALELSAWKAGAFELKTAAGKTASATVGQVAPPIGIGGAWELAFPPHWGAPEKVALEKLISWTEHAEPGVRYFSGTATYTKEIAIDAGLLGPGRSLQLDLGRVKNLAEVKLNGKDLGILWKPPFRVEIGAAARAGTNKLEVRVTNLWANRLIGDEQLPADCEWDGLRLKEWPAWLLAGKPSPSGRLTFTTWHHWKKDDVPLESGLLGPVTLQPAVNVMVALP